MQQIKFWGYVHRSGTIAVKRFWDGIQDRETVRDAMKNSFLKQVFTPEYFDDRDHAARVYKDRARGIYEPKLSKKGKKIKLFKKKNGGI